MGMRRLSRVTALFLILSAVMIAPLAWSSLLPHHGDAYFSVWRLAWAAHQLPYDPAHLFDANIFYPAARTLALSDAMLFEALAGAPAIWLGAHPVAVHNALLLASFVFAGVGMFILAHELCGQTAPAVLAGIIFAFAPYRFAHLGHLELSWIAWMPLALWSAHRLLTRGHLRYALMLGVFVALQGFSSLYHLVFFVPFLGVALTILAGLPSTVQWKRRLALLAVAGAVAAIALTPYLAIYSESRTAHPSRTADEVEAFSATIQAYFRVPPANRMYVFLKRPWGDEDERSLFPGLVAVALSGVALLAPLTRITAAYAVGLVFAFVMSLGPKAGLFSVFVWLVPPLGNFRAPARFGVLVLLCLAGLAAIGAARLMRRSPGRRGTIVVGSLMVLCLAEYWSAPVPVMAPIMKPPAVCEWLAKQPTGSVTLVLPVPSSWLDEALHEYLSTYHWQPLVNGYSGWQPAEYVQTLERLRTFPDAASLDRLKQLNVSYVVITDHFDPAAYRRLLESVKSHAAFDPPMAFPDPVFNAVVLPLRR